MSGMVYSMRPCGSAKPFARCSNHKSAAPLRRGSLSIAQAGFGGFVTKTAVPKKEKNKKVQEYKQHWETSKGGCPCGSGREFEVWFLHITRIVGVSSLIDTNRAGSIQGHDLELPRIPRCMLRCFTGEARTLNLKRPLLVLRDA